MKKSLATAIIAMFLMMPLVSFAKTAILDRELDAVVAQEGITIDFGPLPNPGSALPPTDGVIINDIFPSVISSGDSDGFTGYAYPGYFGMKDILVSSSYIQTTSLMDIDIGTNAGVTKLNIDLPSIFLFSQNFQATIKLDNAGKTLEDTQPALGIIYNNQFEAWLGAITIINGEGEYEVSHRDSSITLSSHTTTQGLEIGFNNVVLSVPRFQSTASWGDMDGFTGYTGAGYFGVRDLFLGEGGTSLSWNNLNDLVTLNGVMSIDVGTSAGVTVLNVVSPTITIGPADITAPLKFGVGRALTGTQVVGSLYVENLGATINSNFKIYSH